MNPLILQIAQAEREWHREQFCSYMPPDQQERVGQVIEDIVVAALLHYEEVMIFAPATKYPIAFSPN